MWMDEMVSLKSTYKVSKQIARPEEPRKNIHRFLYPAVVHAINEPRTCAFHSPTEFSPFFKAAEFITAYHDEPIKIDVVVNNVQKCDAQISGENSAQEEATSTAVCSHCDKTDMPAITGNSQKAFQGT